jgi:hypothetical protein
MILDHDQAGKSAQQSTASMFGIINEFSAELIDPPNLAVSAPNIIKTVQSRSEALDDKV